MNAIAPLTRAFERLPIPTPVCRLAIATMVARSDRALAAGWRPDDEAAFAAAMPAFPIATDTEAANDQHYELPDAFFAAFLGPRRKYSCCLYDPDAPDDDLARAETRAIDATIANAALADGMRILELGCGWGSLSLAMAERFPNARIVAVSNSASQRAAIERLAAARSVANLEIVTADMNAFETDLRFDRIVSVEMFEHMSNWAALLERIRTWLAPDGRLFVHVFSHRDAPYRFRAEDPADWIAQHFFTGGIMPSHALIGRFGHLFETERAWRWSGLHYRRTAEDWLARFDANRPVIDPILRSTYGAEAALWRRRWRLFLLATAGLFGHAGGTVWGVSHHLLSPVGRDAGR